MEKKKDKEKEKKPKTIKVSNMYGRARRIEFAEKCAYIVVGIFAVFLIFYVVSHTFNKVDENVNFAFLKKYMETKGYTCERIDLTGGKCSLHTDVSHYTLIRYDNGFEYLVKTKAYSLTMRHAPNSDSKINFKTTTNAFAGYKAKEYNCSFKENVINELDKCIEVDDGSELDWPAYLGVIKLAMSDLNEMIDNSGYSKEKLLENYEWYKVKTKQED